MRFYFLSAKPAILKLNGLYVGGIDLFERHVEIDVADSVLAEIVPGENLQPVNFFINEKLLTDPPKFLDIYLLDGETLVYVREFGNKNIKLEMIAQTRFSGNLVTVFSQGGVYLSVEGDKYSLTPLPARFLSAQLEEKTVNGLPVLAVRGGSALVVLSEKGEIIFSNEVESVQFGETLDTVMRLETCTSAKAVCSYSYDGEKLTLVRGRTEETVPTDKNIMHFAFFESLLTGGNFADYLDDELKAKAELLKGFLGEYAGVTVPTERFYCEHENAHAAGLVYPKGKNLFEVKYFAVDIENDKISNIYEV